MTISTLLVIATVVAATGAISSHMLRSEGSPYVITIRGSLLHIVVGGIALWSAAIGLGLLVLGVVSLVMPGMVALALFFGVEAVALDICAHRTCYARVEPQPGHTPVPQTVSVRRPF